MKSNRHLLLNKTKKNLEKKKTPNRYLVDKRRGQIGLSGIGVQESLRRRYFSSARMSCRSNGLLKTYSTNRQNR